MKAFREQLEKLDEKSTVELPGTLDGSLEMDLLVEALNDQSATIQKRAMQAYAYWLAAPSRGEPKIAYFHRKRAMFINFCN